MERFKGSPFVLGWNDSRGVLLSWDGTTPGESFCPGMKHLQGSHSVLGWNYSRESFYPEIESPFVLGWNDSRGVLLSSDGTTQGTSFFPGIERLPGSPSVLG